MATPSELVQCRRVLSKICFARYPGRPGLLLFPVGSDHQDIDVGTVPDDTGQLQFVRVQSLRHASACHDVMLVVVDDCAAKADQGIVGVQPDAVPAWHGRDPTAAARSEVHLAAWTDSWAEIDGCDRPVGIPDLGNEFVGEYRGKIGVIGETAGVI